MSVAFTNSSAQGTAAELKAAAILMGLGHEVAVPLSDNGVDLVVDYCLRVQVKTCGVKIREVVPGQRVPLCVWAKLKPAGVDVFILHAEYEGGDRWFVVPSSEIGDVTKTTRSMMLLPKGTPDDGFNTWSSRIRRYEDRWEVLGGPDLQAWLRDSWEFGLLNELAGSDG